MANSHRPASYQKARDLRKRPIRGLWVRNGRYYAQLTIPDHDTGRKSTRRVPLKDEKTNQPVSSVAEAVAAFHRLKVQREDNSLPVLRRTPKFAEFADTYLAAIQNQKGARTVSKERCTLAMWKKPLGELRLDDIKKAHVADYIDKRTSSGISPRTVNLDVICLRQVLKRAVDAGWITRLPTENIRPLKWTAPKRSLVSLADIEAICSAAFQPIFSNGAVVKAGQGGQALKNAQQFVDYMRLLAFTGARMREALRLKWTDVDWTRKQLTIGADGQTKNHEARVVDFNPKLEVQLREMATRRAPDSDWIFPSPQRGDQDLAAKTFRESLLLARTAARHLKFGFHDCRHSFISYSVMAGIDYMTIARWVGHKDGGVLIGKVYGHLSNEHAQRQAQKLHFASSVGQPDARETVAKSAQQQGNAAGAP